MYDAIIFDWDGTLANTRQVVVIAFQKVLKEIGCQVNDEFLDRLIGIGARNMFRKALESNGTSFEEEELDQLVNKKIEVQLELSGQIKLFDGVINLLNALHTRIKIALATMSNRKIIIEMINKKGIDSFFDIIITADETHNSKPYPEIFLRCSKELNSSPESCIVVEDSIFGVIAAKKANMKCIAIPSGSYSKKELQTQKPDLIIESINEKRKVLKFIFGDDSLQ
jgi:HAD superfamily hydrolase (TIGR01509 family)